jgi:hypothetical protein
VDWILDRKGVIVQSEEDRNDINLSGVATVVDDKSPLKFVHLTYAEFLTARNFNQMLLGQLPHEDMEVDEVKQFVHKLFKEGVSDQTMRFVERFCDKNKDKTVHTGVLECTEDIHKDIFERICLIGMRNLYSFLLRQVYDGENKVRQWMVESHAASNNGMSLYFYACRSSPKLAKLLSEWCPMLQIDDVDKLFDDLATRNGSLHCIELALSRVEDWKSRWPRANFFDKYLNSGFSPELYEFLLEICPDIDSDVLIQKIYSKKRCCKDFLPILLHLGADLNCENNGVRLAHIIFRDTDRGGHIELLKFAIKVGKHFQVTKNVDSKESLLLRKNIGAKSPQELGLDSTSDEGRGLYLQHIVECACALLDTGECEPGNIFRSTYKEVFNLKQISNIPDELRPIATTYKLQWMRTRDGDDAVRMFQEEQKWIARDFKYSCGCTFVHDACRNHNLPLLETLDQNGFDLKSTNKKGETPLHWAAFNHYLTKCREYLLKRFLGQFYVPLDAKREEIVARTPDEQRDVEDTLSERDAEGRPPLLAAVASHDLDNAMLLFYNLLGPLVILENEELVTRTELEQQQVERILSARDADGCTALHYTLVKSNEISVSRILPIYSYAHADFLTSLLRNLLRNYFIEGTQKPMQRTLEKQKQIAQLLQPKNNKGQTPLLIGAKHHFSDNSHLLFLRNVLGEYFVEEDGTTMRPLKARTDEENQFVRDVMFGEDDNGQSPYGLVQTSDVKYKYAKLWYKANARYLLPKKKCVIC